MPTLVTRRAPDFEAPALMPDGRIEERFHFAERTAGKFAVVFFYPLDFTFVCPTELVALDHRFDAFAQRDATVLAVSVDSVHTHRAWRDTPVERGGIGPVRYPLIGDVRHEVTCQWGVEHPDEGVALRATFIVDPEGIVRHATVGDLDVGRNLDEVLRVLDALREVREHGVTCPAGWRPGSETLEPDPEAVARYLASHADEL